MRRRVLLNASFRDLPFGTGIGGYTRSVAEAISRLGHDIAWLSGAAAPARADALVDSAAVRDRAPASGGGLRRTLNTARLMSRALTAPSMTARAVGRGEEQVFLAPEIYEIAHYRNTLTRTFCEVRMPVAVDLLHLTAPLPLRMPNTPTITTIHDLAPILHPQLTPDNKAEFAARVRASAKLSNVILTVSEASRQEILATLDLPESKVVALHQPTDMEPLGPDDDEAVARTLQRFGLTRGDYILWCGAIEPKKNVRRLVEAYAESKLDMPLALVGRPAWFADQELDWMQSALSPAIRDRVRLLGHVEREDLRRLYAGALMFAFPSLYEGFGLPALEAMTMGCPLLASTTPALKEVCGDGALLAEPHDRDDIRQKLEQLAGDAALRARLVEAGRKRASAFSMEAFTAGLGAAYAQAGLTA